MIDSSRFGLLEVGVLSENVPPASPGELARVPYDPELAAALRIIMPTIPKMRSLDDVPGTRDDTATMPLISDAMLERSGRFQVQETSAPGLDGRPDVPLLICRPTWTTARTPCLLHIHGGGMIAGDNRTGIQDALDTAELVEAAVVSVGYRLAPETPHPGPVEDCYTSLCWVAANAALLGIDPRRVVLMGTSAGGGLAAATALLARDRGGPAVAAQLLMEPMLDDRNVTVSSRQEIGRGVWDRVANQVGWSALLGDLVGTDRVSPYAAPARAADLSGLPPTFIDVGSAEVFRDEAVAFASGIWQAGGVAELHVWAGGFHGFDVLAPFTAVSRAERATRDAWLTKILTCSP